MFSFDVKEYLDEGGEGSPKEARMTDELRAQLFDITDRLNASLDTLVSSCGPIRQRFHDIRDQLPDHLSNIISPAVFLEQYEQKYHRVIKRMADRDKARYLGATIEVCRQQINKDKMALDQLAANPSLLGHELTAFKAREEKLIKELQQ